MKKNDIILVVLLILAVEAFLLWKKSRNESPVPEMVTSKTEAPQGSVAASTTTTIKSFQPSQMNSDLNAEPEEPTRNGFIKIQNPFCQSEAQGVIVLPSLFLKEFYTHKDSWIALPNSLSSCFQEKKTAQFIFSEYQPSHQFPWEPLVRMEGRILSITNYAALSALEKEVDGKKYNIKASRKNSGIFDVLKSNFSQKASEPWRLIKISVSSIEQYPPFWPGPPNFHFMARFISGNDLKSFAQKNPGSLIVVDARAKEQKEKFKLAFPSVSFKANHPGSHRVLIEPSNFHLSKNQELLKIDPNKSIVVVGRDSMDVNAYNAANFLTLAGYKRIYILKGGAQDLGGAPYERETLSGPFITVEDLKRAKTRNKNLLLIDCRNPGTTKSLIQGAARISFREGAKDEEEIDLTDVNKELHLRRPTEIVLFGSNGLDPKPNRVKNLLNLPTVKFSTLQDGYNSWQFFAKYKWSDVEPHKPVRSGAHAPPERKRGMSAGKAPIKVDPKETLGSPAGSVPAKRLENSEIEKAKARGAKIR